MDLDDNNAADDPVMVHPHMHTDQLLSTSVVLL
jgi:hypothetical protein